MSQNYLKDKADEYLRKNRIVELFEDLCTAICFKKPDNIKIFLIEQLKLKKQQGFKTGVFNKEEVQNIFTLFDLKKEGKIGKQTCKDALKTFAASDFTFTEIDEASIPDKVDIGTFTALYEKFFLNYQPSQKQQPQSNQPKDMTQDDLKRACREIFQEYDKNLNGVLDQDEFMEFAKKLLSDLGLAKITENDIKNAMKTLDLDGNGKLSLPEFEVYVNYIYQAQQKEKQTSGNK